MRGLLGSFSGVHSLLLPLVSMFGTAGSVVLQQASLLSFFLRGPGIQSTPGSVRTLNQARQK